MPELLCEYEGFESAYLQAMEVDPNTNTLWWTAYSNKDKSPFVKIDLETGDLTVVKPNLLFELCALIIPDTTNVVTCDFNDDGYVDDRDANALGIVFGRVEFSQQKTGV